MIRLRKVSGLGYGTGELLVSWNKRDKGADGKPIIPTRFRCEYRFTPSRIDGTDLVGTQEIEVAAVPHNPEDGTANRELGVMVLHVDPITGVAYRVEDLEGNGVAPWDKMSKDVLEIQRVSEHHWLQMLTGIAYAMRPRPRHSYAPKQFNTVLGHTSLAGLVVQPRSPRKQ